jgi:nitrite reductase/ring-hydroxylating ferredoxin subunit
MNEGPACKSEDLAPGRKVAVDFTDAKALLWRTAAGEVKAYARLCPHVGVDLADGWHDGDVVHCPGHGLRFSWRDGASNCASFRLRAFSVEERNGSIFLSRASTAGDAEPAERVGA